ncbi:hypothetical protein SAICODRAFT_8064 [Saitoella complicata NRRL Y-17804]|uniref:NADH-ubiquinone oxidoreductase subunit B14.7 n=1 Tax=Saitoella complicata (strain BCRC 22490 / CBS 7301 / JCM 7358 / NBRC 10748 / NRRL Y-17804) TaxID=698492 RepID=A0A0E9NS02_SAICN|nr:uncharacterized protein SAICODRAFT_8064 [Saitoella complicata NRRL Y-17804]ODQ52234.1 hypothetical protein SAICODRAFT_8064 [Saitoella complicata NRRL Y-17804]GAO52654.1 hypothetical protein G7K_6726-t1 [Saitoella complicata NRRL Y-17804]
MAEIFGDTVKGGIASALTGGSVAASVAVLKNKPTNAWAIPTAISCGVFGGCFFGVRQIILTGTTGFHSRLVTDKDRLCASGVSGALVGGFLNAIYQKNARAAIPAAIVYGLIGTSGQLTINFVQSLRRSYILHKKVEAGELEPELAAVLPSQEKKWWSYSPIRQITSEDHRVILQEKLVNVDMQIAQVDAELEHIMKLEEDRN